LISEEGVPLLIDFGLSKYSSKGNQEMEGHLTLRWSSPELLSGGFKTFSSDVYAFAITISEVTHHTELSYQVLKHVSLQVLSGYIPFKRIRAQAAVVGAVIRGERPEKKPLYSPGRYGYSYNTVWEIASDGWKAESEGPRPTIHKILERLEEFQFAISLSKTGYAFGFLALLPQTDLLRLQRDYSEMERISITPGQPSICDSRMSTEESHWNRSLRWVSAKFKGIRRNSLSYDDDAAETMTTGQYAKMTTTASLTATHTSGNWSAWTPDTTTLNEIPENHVA
jgi:serine/threonine protein kinase